MDEIIRGLTGGHHGPWAKLTSPAAASVTSRWS